jgi:hypothetical protein
VTPSGVEVIVVQVRHVIAAKPTDVISTETSNVAAVKAAHATSTAHVASTEATYVTSAEAAHATTMSSTAPAASAGLCPGD